MQCITPESRIPLDDGLSICLPAGFAFQVTSACARCDLLESVKTSINNTVRLVFVRMFELMPTGKRFLRS